MGQAGGEWFERIRLMKDYKEAWEQWQAIAIDVNRRGQAIDRSIHERGWALAASVGIPRCGCSLHNASIDTDLKGWCKDSPHRLKVAKEANYLLSLWPGSRLADKIQKSAWNRLVAKPFGYCPYTLE